MTLRYSRRAKINTTRQMRGVLAFLKANLKSKQIDLQRMRRYRKYGLRGYSQMYRAHVVGLRKISNDIAIHIKLINRYYKSGKIYKIQTQNRKTRNNRK